MKSVPVKWPEHVPFAGAFIAGRHDELPDAPDGFSLTPSAETSEEVPDEGPEQPV